MFERFTVSARHVVVRAQEAARELGHAHIGTEHQLLGLLADPESDASQALDSLGVTADHAREWVLEIVPAGDRLPEGFIPFTARAKKMLSMSLREALDLGHRQVTPEHLLLGLTHVPDGVAMQVLVGQGADQAAIRAAAMAVLPARVEAGPQIPRASQPQPGIVSSDPVVRRLLTGAAGRALDDGRTEFGLSDLLVSAADDEEAATALESLGIDVSTLRFAIAEEGTTEGSAD